MSQTALRTFAGAVLAAGAVAALGLLPAGAGACDAHAAFAWCAFVAVPAGALSAARGGSRGALAAGGVACGVALVAGAAAAWGARAVPSPAGAVAALAALVAVGHAAAMVAAWLAARADERNDAADRARTVRATAGVLALLAALAAGLPGRAGLAESGFAERRPRLGALLLDLSPLTWVFESAGLDWQRHPAVYGPAGTDWFSGGRAPYARGVATPLALVLGCAAVAAVAACAGPRPRRAGPEHP